MADTLSGIVADMLSGIVADMLSGIVADIFKQPGENTASMQGLIRGVGPGLFAESAMIMCTGFNCIPCMQKTALSLECIGDSC